MTPRPLLLVALLGAAFTTSAFAKSDLETINRIRNEGLYHSQVMTTLQHLTDDIGPRLTGSPGMDAAQNWMLQVYQRLGITARRERYGTWRGWRPSMAVTVNSTSVVSLLAGAVIVSPSSSRTNSATKGSPSAPGLPSALYRRS